MSSAAGRVLVRVVMFVDISGSSWLYRELGDEAAVRRVRGCLSRLGRVVNEYGGRTIKHIGDGLMCEFAFADHALQAGEAMHMTVADDEGAVEPNLGIHIGCHLGQVIESGGDVFGDAVNLAARVAGVARTGQLLITQQTVDALSPALQMNTRPLDRVSVKGQSDAMALFEYLWRQQGELTVLGVPAVQVMPSRLRIGPSGHEVWLDRQGGRGSVLLGRDRACGVAVSDPAASRHHATIEVRGDRFVLIDHSANGTYVASGTTETCLKREEIILPSSGRLGLGKSPSASGVTVLEFSRYN